MNKPTLDDLFVKQGLSASAAFVFLAAGSICMATLLAAALPASAQPRGRDTPNATPWWKNAVLYEIYPRSFQDSDGDGIGDLRGITSRLDYLKQLGVDAVWIAPCFPSPLIDMGYDVSDYTAIGPEYGTMLDFDRMVAEAKKRNIRILLDFVVNHTSDKHAWFVESASSRSNPKADWYVWRDGKGPEGKEPPNNWTSRFGGGAWEYSSRRNQFYYHAFAKEQPDLNWRNPDVRKAMYDVMRFWMNKGVSGFRLDAVEALFEDEALRDNPPAEPGSAPSPRQRFSPIYTQHLPETHDVLREMRKVVDAYPGGVLVGETYLPNIEGLRAIYGNNDEIQLPMDTQVFFRTGLTGTASLGSNRLREKLKEAESLLPVNQPLLVSDNHDNPRSWDRFGDGQHNPEIAKLLATFLLAPRTTVLLYYGQELGMRTAERRPGASIATGRDGERTPMQWDSSANAGFTTGKPWLPVEPAYPQVNVAAELKDSASILSFYRDLAHLRKENPALRDGSFALVNEADPNLILFTRTSPAGQSVLIGLNTTPHEQKLVETLTVLGLPAKHAKVLLASFPLGSQPLELDKIVLPPFGSLIAELR